MTFIVIFVLDQLIVNTREETVKSALLQEKGSVTAFTLQKQVGLAGPWNLNCNSSQNYSNLFKIKQEPTLSVQRKKNNQSRTIRAQNSRERFDNRPNQNQSRESKPCYFCAKNFSPNHKLSWPAKNATCKKCNKNGHFAIPGVMLEFWAKVQ